MEETLGLQRCCFSIHSSKLEVANYHWYSRHVQSFVLGHVFHPTPARSSQLSEMPASQVVTMVVLC